MAGPLEILELRSAVAGVPAAEIRRIIELRLPLVPAPIDAPEFDAWTWSLYDLGLAAETIPDLATAIDLYARSIGCNRSALHLRSAAWVRTGLCLEQLGRWVEAKQSYLEGLEGSFGWRENRALLLWRLGCLQFAAEESVEALSSFGQLLELLPQPGIPRHEVILKWTACLEGAGRTAEAEAALKELAAASHPSSVDALLRLSSLYLRRSQCEAAAAALDSVIGHPMTDSAVRSSAALRLEQLLSQRK